MAINWSNLNPLSKFFLPDQGQVDREETVKRRVAISESDLEFMSSYGTFNETGSLTENINFSEAFQSKIARKLKYREMSFFPEISQVLDAAADDALPTDDKGRILEPYFHADVPKAVRTKMEENFEFLVYGMYDLHEHGWDWFRKFLVEAEQFIELLPDKSGKDVKDPKTNKKGTEQLKPGTATIAGFSIMPSAITFPVYKNGQIQYYIQSPHDIAVASGNSNFGGGSQANMPAGGSFGMTPVVVGDHKRLTLNQVAYAHYGVFGRNSLDVIGYLETAVRAYNQLRGLEDAIIVYRMARAPQRRIWNVEVGKMGAARVAEYMQRIMSRYRRKSVYNPSSGEVDSVRNVQSVIDDFWFPKRHGEGSSVEEFGGNIELGEINDLKYFLSKLYKGLRYPKTRWADDSSGNFNMFKPGEIDRDEISWMKLVDRIRRKWANGIILGPWMQLNRMSLSESELQWNDSYHINYTFVEDNLFATQKKLDMLEQKFAMLGNASQHIRNAQNENGPFAEEYVLREMFGMSDEDWELNQKYLREQAKNQPAADSGDEDEDGFGSGRTPPPADEEDEDFGDGP